MTFTNKWLQSRHLFYWAYVIMSASEPICLHEWRTANCSTKYVKTMLDYAGYQKGLYGKEILKPMKQTKKK